jgi:EpsI family protein
VRSDVRSNPNDLSNLPATWFVWAVTPIVLLALWPSTLTLINFWLLIKDYQYGLVVAPLCLVWLYVAAGRIGNIAARPAPWALPLLIMSTIAWAAAYLAVSDMTHQVLLPVILWLVIVASSGSAAGRVSAEPIACLYLAMPLWDYLLPALQRATVIVTEGLLRLMGIPATVMATTVRIPEGSFKIAEGCAGKKYFMVAVTLGVLLGAYCRLSVRGRLLLIGAAAILALCTNWLRVITIVVAGHLTNMQHYLVAKEHLTFGSVLFFLLIVVLGIISRVLSRKLPGAAVQPAPGELESITSSTRIGWSAFALLPLAIPLATRFASIPSAAVRLGSLPLLADEWQGPLSPSSNWQPKFNGAADEARASYRSQTGTVEVYLNVYGPQQNGRELVNYNNALLPSGSWQVESTGMLTANTDERSGLPLLKSETVVSGTNRWLFGYLYTTGGHIMHTDIGVQLSYGVLDLIGTPASGVVAIAARCADDCDAAHRLLKNFWKYRGAELVELIPKSYSDH